MRYRGLNGKNEMIYGLPSYGFHSEDIKEIGTPEGDFEEVKPGTIGEYTGFNDKNGTGIYTGDITKLILPGEVRLFEVTKTMVDRELVPPKGFSAAGKNIVRLHTYAFIWIDTGNILLPCVDIRGKCDAEKMVVVGNVHQNPELLIKGARYEV